MFIENSFGKNLDILHRTMDVSLLRQDVIANNIANVDTPNFSRTVVNFETKLAEALQQEKKNHFRAATTHPGHVAFKRALRYTDVRPNRQLDYTTTSKNNGNNVDIESETSNLLNNQLLYTLMVSSTDSMFDRMRIVLG